MSTQTMVVAGGCFWGLEALFRDVHGVVDTEVGYTGGSNDSPTYGNHPGYAEAIRLTYDPALTSFEQLLDFFFRIHDPTTRNRQGNDVGESYRSAVFYGNDDERRTAQALIQKVNDAGLYTGPVVTSLERLGTFFSAEDYHQDYLQKHPGGYTCHFIRREEPIMSAH